MFGGFALSSLLGGKIGKILSKGLIVVGIVAAIGIPVYFAYSFVTNLQEQNSHLSEEVSELKTSNDSLEDQIEKMNQERELILKEIREARKTDQASEERVEEFEKKLESEERKSRIDKIEIEKKSLLLRKSNNQAECQWEHFADFDGECVSGRWVPDGGRVVPKEDNNGDDESEENNE